MAAQLENAKIDHDDMKDLHESLTGHKWVDEKTVKICYKCERDFTIKRRKVNFHGPVYRSVYEVVKWIPSYRWSFHPNSAWSRIETTTIGKTQPTLI